MLCATCHAVVSADARFCGACGNAVQSTERSADPVPGAFDHLVGREVAGRYRLVAKLGEGGMGAVFRSEQISLKRTVAVKVLKPSLSADHGLVRRFHAEAELAAKLNHPNTVTLFDFGQDADGTLFIAMEHIEGRSLRQVLQSEGPLPAERALAICEQVAASLSDAHAHGIIHRDLKPDNIMLTERGRQRDVVRVLDFGIAKLRDERGDVSQLPVTQAGDLLGTPQYMAPEQIRGERVDGRTDVYALGALLYEMVTGRLPFEAPTVMAILGKHLTDTPVPPAHRRPDLPIPNALDQLIMSALEKPTEARPTMDAMGEHLADLATRLDTPSRPRAKAPAQPVAAAPGAAPAQPAAAAIGVSNGTGPVGRPPGVPTSPPGVMTPANVGLASPFAHPTPPQVVAAGLTGPGAAPRRRSALWVGGTLGIGALAAAATILAMQSAGSDAPSTAASLTAQGLSGELYTSRHRWSFRVPTGFSEEPTDEKDAIMWVGATNGASVRVFVASARLDTVGDLDLSNPMEILDGVAEEFDGIFIDSGSRLVDATPRPTGIYHIPAIDQTCEFDLFVGTVYAAVIAVCTDEARFEAAGAMLDEYISQRFVAPP